ncbi:hypothetical protein BS78_K060700 [Paspalum vaginatum]|uniref:Uncharacterized protein n=1 Tax=Paspalum vaginatum TaxID=158149 RepID=A0A9W7XA60_9POAL|nr:hypothetical protein BS78_K060700 [Paspalum vaginatum]
MHLIFLPMYYAQSWYLVVANFRTGRFEVICPISMDCNEIERDASTVIQNFKWMFKLAYPHSVRVNVFKMSTTTLIASSAKNLRVVRVYRVGEKGEIVRDHDVYGWSGFPATVSRVVDDLSYLVEYFDLEEGGGGPEKAVEYLHWRFIRPAVEHCPSESEFQLGPGAAVEAYCDGALSPGVISRALGGGEFDVKVVGKNHKKLVGTKVVELLKPRYKWNGNHWRIVASKRRTNLRTRPMSGTSPSLPIDLTSSGETGDEQMHGPESFGTKRSRKLLKQLDAISTNIPEHASPSEIVTPLSALCKSPESKLPPNSGCFGKNSSQVLSHGTLNSVPNINVLDSKKLADSKGPKELCSQHSSLDVTGTVQQMGRKKVAEPTMKESPLPLGSTKSITLTQEQICRTLEDTPIISQLPNQEGLFSAVPPGFESMYNGKGSEITDHAAAKVARSNHDMETANQVIETALMKNSLSQVNRNDAATKVAKTNHVIKTAIVSPDGPVQQAGGKVANRSGLLLNASSSKCTMNSSPFLSCSSSGSLLPSPLPLSQMSGHQVLFTKSSPMWALVEALGAFKDAPQQPHFLTLRKLNPDLREGIALGLMVSFADLVKSTREASIDNSIEWFEDKISTLCHLEGNGFNVHSLQSTLTRLVKIKSNRTRYLEEIDKLKAKAVAKKASSAQIEALLDAKEIAIVELEQQLGPLHQDSQKIAKDKDNEEAKLLNIKVAQSRFEEAFGDAERQFQSILTELHRKQLT